MVKKLIMLVEDEPSVLNMVKEIVERAGYATVTASGGLQALRKLKKVKPDLILLDYFMPGMNGLELCKKIRADDALKDLKIVFFECGAFLGHSGVNSFESSRLYSQALY